MLRLSAWLALAFGAVLTAGQIYRNLGNWDLWITWTVDVLCGLSLIAAGLMSLRKAAPPRYLAGAWGVATGLYVAGLINYSITPNDLSPTLVAVNQRRALILAGLVAASLVGLISSLMAQPTVSPDEDARL